MRTSIIARGLAVALLAGCGSACTSTMPSQELVEARKAYDRVRVGPAASIAPDSVYAARNALVHAEKIHADSPQSEDERSAAYVARRRAELAEVHAATAKARQDESRAQAEYAAVQDRLRVSAETALDSSRGQVRNLGSELAAQQTENAATRSELGREKAARSAAEERAARAMKSLETIAQVKEEARGVVITMSGQVLFVTGKAELLPAARDQLGSVAKALIDQGSNEPIVVEGHTDSRGSDADNQRLSEERAESVRAFLASAGIPARRLTAVGKGESSPVASNDSAEGRANNRRVEIVIGRAAPRIGPSGEQSSR